VQAQLRCENQNFKQARILHSPCSQYHPGRGRSCWSCGDKAGGKACMSEKARNGISQKKLQTSPGLSRKTAWFTS